MTTKSISLVEFAQKYYPLSEYAYGPLAKKAATHGPLISPGSVFKPPPNTEQKPYAYACPVGCGCFWRDNHDGTMSLFMHQKSCDVCEHLSLSSMIPLYANSAPLLEDWQLLPKVPTLFQVNAARHFLHSLVDSAPWSSTTVRDLYKVFLDTAPSLEGK